MSNVYSKISTKPVKRFQESNLAETQTNAWVNGEDYINFFATFNDQKKFHFRYSSQNLYIRFSVSVYLFLYSLSFEQL